MSNQSGTNMSKEEGQALERRMYDQFEAAKRLYAAHRLLLNAPQLDRQKIVEFWEHALIEFKAAGGLAKAGTDVFGESGPVLCCENGEVVPYDAGRMLAETYISSGKFR